MCNPSVLSFGEEQLTAADVRGKRVLEIGSTDVNGSLRAHVTALGPKEYVGVDIAEGRGVDVVCKAEDLMDKFGRESFDLVISTEMLEHVKDWRRVVSNTKGVCKRGGGILLTTRSFGFKYHAFPHDFWRFELDDMKAIFSDCEIVALAEDPRDPGVLLKVRKGPNFKEADLSDHALYNMVSNRKSTDLTDEDFNSWHFKKIQFGIGFREKRKRLERLLFSPFMK